MEVICIVVHSIWDADKDCHLFALLSFFYSVLSWTMAVRFVYLKPRGPSEYTLTFTVKLSALFKGVCSVVECGWPSPCFVVYSYCRGALKHSRHWYPPTGLCMQSKMNLHKSHRQMWRLFCWVSSPVGVGGWTLRWAGPSACLTQPDSSPAALWLCGHSLHTVRPAWKEKLRGSSHFAAKLPHWWTATMTPSLSMPQIAETTLCRLQIGHTHLSVFSTVRTA